MVRHLDVLGALCESVNPIVGGWGTNIRLNGVNVAAYNISALFQKNSEVAIAFCALPR